MRRTNYLEEVKEVVIVLKGDKLQAVGIWDWTQVKSTVGDKECHYYLPFPCLLLQKKSKHT